jgi:hypothetical protein
LTDEANAAEASPPALDVDAPRLFEPPPARRARAHQEAIAENLEPAPVKPPPELFDRPLQAVEEESELWRSVTAEEETLLSEALPRAGCTLPVGKEVYGALVRIGMRKKRRPLRPSDWFEASRAELVDELKEHCQERQLGSYLRALREGGLLERRRRRQGSNRWRLPHYRAPSRTAIHCRSRDQGRQPIADQTGQGRQWVADPSENREKKGGENGTRTQRKVVAFPSKRRQAPNAPDFDVGVRR